MKDHDYLEVIHQILIEDGIDSQFYSYDEYAVCVALYDCQSFWISLDIRTAEVVVGPDNVHSYGIKEDPLRTRRFPLASPQLSENVVEYIKNYRPPKINNPFIKSVSQRLDIQRKSRR